MWHNVDCQLGGPTGPEDVHGGLKRYWEGEEHWPELTAERGALAPSVQDVVGCAMENIGAGEQGVISLGTMNPGDQVEIIVTDNLPPGPIVIGNFTQRDTGIVRALAGLDYGYRTCCSTHPGSPHWQGCGTYFFAEGQTVIKPDFNPMDPWGRARLRLKEDTGASDRTFENETRPL